MMTPFCRGNGKGRVLGEGSEEAEGEDDLIAMLSTGEKKKEKRKSEKNQLSPRRNPLSCATRAAACLAARASSACKWVRSSNTERAALAWALASLRERHSDEVEEGVEEEGGGFFPLPLAAAEAATDHSASAALTSASSALLAPSANSLTAAALCSFSLAPSRKPRLAQRAAWLNSAEATEGSSGPSSASREASTRS